LANLIKQRITAEDFENWKSCFQPDVTLEEFRELLEQIKKEEEQDKSYSFLLKSDDHLIGFIQVFSVLRHPACSGCIEISIAGKYQRKGFGKKAIQILEAFCFEELGLCKLIAPIVKENKASIALFSSLAYERLYTDPYAFFFNTKPKAHEIFVKLSN
jgi:RimJ/RimL family protein N-acetyltransferase